MRLHLTEHQAHAAKEPGEGDSSSASSRQGQACRSTRACSVAGPVMLPSVGCCPQLLRRMSCWVLLKQAALCHACMLLLPGTAAARELLVLLKSILQDTHPICQSQRAAPRQAA